MNEKNIQRVGILESTLGYTFRKKELAIQALTHRSWVGDYGSTGDLHSEILEFLGDSVLDLIIAYLLMQEDDSFSEGVLTKKRAFLVNKTHLSQKAAEIKLGELIRLGKGEEKSGGRNKPSILADAFESVIGAVFLDSGYDKCFQIVKRLFSEIENENNKVSDSIIMGDFKSALQEVTQKEYKNLPVYRFAGAFGPEHDILFSFDVIINNEEIAKGTGKTKKAAQQDGARKALEIINQRLK